MDSRISGSTGFILTRQQKIVEGEACLEFWLSTDQGPLKLLTPAQKTVFFIRRDEQSKAAEALLSIANRWEIKPLGLKTFEGEAVSGVYLRTAQDGFKVKDLLLSANIECFEDDIRLTERYLMERFIYGAASFSGQQTSMRGGRYPIVSQGFLKPCVYKPSFRVLSVDIECSEHFSLYSIGFAAADFRCVLMIGKPQAGPDYIRWVDDEKALLRAFVEVVDEYDPDIFVGWNVVNFDFKVLIECARRLQVALPLGRGKELISWREARNDSGQGFVTMPGRLIIDGIDALKTATYHFDSFSLEFVAQALLGKGKQTEDVSNRLATINHDFQHNKAKLAAYNLEDCLLVLDIFAHTRILDFLILRSQLTGLELDRLGGSVAAFLNLYLPKLHRAGYVSPNRPANGGLASPGGYVMDSFPGLYQHVLVLDFKSLYPSIIRTFKIDPMGLHEGLACPDDAIPGYKGAVFSRDKHFLPDIITSLWQQRDEAKKQLDGARSQAIKILMNSFYGVLGSGGCPFYDTRLASSITMRGHDIMKTTAQWIEQRGYKVIYGDTDSTFVWLDGEYTNQQAKVIGRTLQDEINTAWHKKIKEELDLACYLEIEFETHFEKFLMPTIRGSELGSKKRYAGLKSVNDTTELVFKGLETVRSDWTELAKDFQKTLYQMVFDGEDVAAYIQDMIDKTRKGEMDDLLVYRKRLRQSLDKYTKNVPPHVKAARIADERNASLGMNLKYQQKGWISYVITTSGPQPLEYVTSPLDYDHYISKQIQPIADGILPFINQSFDKIASDQLSLF